MFFVRVHGNGPLLFVPVSGIELVKFVIEGLLDLNWIESSISSSKALFLAFGELIGFHEPLIGGFSWFIGASEFSIKALFGFKLHHRLEEILKVS